MILTMVLHNGWATKQVDFTNAFVQTEMKDTAYIEAPKLFGPKSGKYLVLLLLKSLYGLKQAPRTFYEKLIDGLLERGFTQSEIDPCLFMKKDCICVVYMDDTIFAGPDASLLEREIKSLGVKEDQCEHSFQLRYEGEVGDFLGILTQTGLIEKMIRAGSIEDCKKVATLAETSPVGADLDLGVCFNCWNANVLGIKHSTRHCLYSTSRSNILTWNNELT
jgi:hypothetical protein